MMPPGKWYCELYVTGGANGPTVSGGVYLLEDQPASQNNYQNSPTTYGTYGGASPGYGNGTLMGLAYDNKLKELIINPDFNYDGDWVLDGEGGTWSIADGKASNSGGGEIYQTISVVNNKTYLMTATIDCTADSSIGNTTIGFRANDNSGYLASDTSHTANAINNVSIEWTSNLTGNVRARCYSSDTISITKWNVKEVDATVTFYKNGSLYGSTARTDVPGMKSYCFGAMGYSYNPDTDRKIFYNANFGQKPFSYTPPTGYVALCSKNIANEFADTTNVGITTGGSYSGKVIIRPQRHFDTVLYSNGGGSAVNVNTLEFKPDLIWVKSRNANANHGLYDSVRGDNKRIVSDLTNTESTVVGPVPSDSGFSIAGSSYYNPSGTAGSATFVAWCWKAGGAPTTTNSASVGSVPTAGSVKIDGVDATAPLAGTRYPDKMSVYTKAGFSIVKYTGTGSAFTLAHGLDRAPDVQLVKTLDGANVNWMFYTKVRDGSQDYMFLNTTDSLGDSGFSGTTDTVFNFNVGASIYSNTNGRNYIMYSWASIPGYSKCFMYTANNSSDGAFFHCGFRPAFIMIKNMDNSSAHWYMIDDKRNPENECRISLKANQTGSEVTDTNFIDFLSNGFKLRTNGGYVNNSYHRIFYMAFAEQSGKTEFNLITNAR